MPNNTDDLKNIHIDIIRSYEQTVDKLLLWIQDSENTRQQFLSLSLASSYLLLVSHFQDCFIQLIHRTFCYYDTTEWRLKPKFIKIEFSKIAKEYTEHDIVSFVHEYQHRFYDLFDKQGVHPTIKNTKFKEQLKNYYYLDTNKYINLAKKLEDITAINLIELEITLDTYQNILDKRNKYAHNKIPDDISFRGVESEIKDFHRDSIEWLNKVSEKILEKCIIPINE